MKITLQQCIFLISNLTKKQSQLFSSLNSQYFVPLTVNGKDMVDKSKSKEMLERLKEIEILNQDLVTLKNALCVANNKNKIGKQTLFAALEDVRLKRNLLSNMKYALSREYNRVETGVGVVRYGIMNEEILKGKRDKLEKEVNNLSSKIDSMNASVEIEVKLLGEY